jgi:hypothetical protein
MRRRIRRIKDRLYPWYIDAARRRRAWGTVRANMKRMSDAMREAYAKARARMEQKQEGTCHEHG